MQDLTPITPAMFLFDISTAEVKDLDVRDANHFRKRLRFRPKVIEELRKRLRSEYLELILGKDGLARTVKLKTQSSTLIRPIQRVFPLELSGNDLTSLLLQKIQLTELSVNSPNPETPVKFPISKTSVKYPIPDFSKANEPQVTRCGRAIKRPKRLNLVTLNDVFE
ncbi:hypothetical protein AVEN_91690-1 [Araneus ventricosus]|uniref:DUF5641 domain-containing protein n=1 Tax=Araneus ventricosus TaxID=182803 RepID=A0A4Y2S336_ARAVE|nr:hypothetical protein AVEN_91690-1 [Araneus ventricosus]